MRATHSQPVGAKAQHMDIRGTVGNVAPTIYFAGDSFQTTADNVPFILSHPVEVLAADGLACTKLTVTLTHLPPLGHLGFWNDFPGHGAVYMAEGNPAVVTGMPTSVNWALANVKCTHFPDCNGEQYLSIRVDDLGSCIKFGPNTIVEALI
jgi:hypothetical protein